MEHNTTHTLVDTAMSHDDVADDEASPHCNGIAHDACTCEGDGRVKRRIRNRQSMLDALGELIQSGVAEPSLEDVAEHAGVSSRSVYRHFGSMEEARQEWADEVVRFVGGFLDNASGPVLPAASLEDRCRSLVSARLDLYDEVGSVVRTANARRFFSERAAREYEAARSFVDGQVPERFATELDAMSEGERVVRLGVFNAIVSIDMIDDLMVRLGDHRDALIAQLSAQLVAALSR